MDAGVKCIRFTSIFANCLFCLFGIFLATFGALIEWKYNAYASFFGPQIWIIPRILIIAGSIVIVINLLGIWGASRGNCCILMTFALSFFILFISELVFGAIAYVQRSNLGAIMEPLFNETMIHYKEREYYQHSWKILQTEFECCGIYGPEDWENNFANTTLLPSCCTVINLNEADSCTMKHAHQEGCLPKMLGWLDKKEVVFIIVALVLASVQLLVIMYACCLNCSFCSEYRAINRS